MPMSTSKQVHPSPNQLSQAKPSVNKAEQQPSPHQAQNNPVNQLQSNSGNQQVAQLDALIALDIQEPELEVISQTILYQPLMKHVLHKFGVGRRAFRRSKELNEFRSGLKSAAREQAQMDVAGLIDSNASLTGKSDSAKTYYKLLANVESRSLAKVSVDSILSQESERIIQRLLPINSTIGQLKQAIVASHSVPDNPSKAKLKEQKKAALTTAQDKAKQLLELYSEVAINEARVITKGDKFEKDSQRDQQRVNELTADTKKQVKRDEVGKRSVDLAVEAKTIDSGMAKISPIIHQAIPAEGDEASLSFELKIPVASNAFVVIDLGAEAANEGDHIELGSNINVGAGGSIGIAELAAKIGMFLEASGSSISSALTLLSYGMYRHMNVAFPSIAQRLWGLNNKTGLSTLEEAELWAAAVESEHLQDVDNFVSVGQQISLEASLETGIYEGELSVQAQRYTMYNKENMENLAALHNEKQASSNPQASIVDKVVLFGDAADTSKAALAKKAKLLNQLSTYKKYSVSAENKLELGVTSLAFSGEGSLTYFNGLKDNLEASISIDLPESIGGFSGWSTITETVIPKIIETIGTIQGLLADSSQSNQSEEESDSIPELRNELEARAAELGDSLAGLSEGSAAELETDSGLAVTFNFEKSWEDGVPKEWEIGFDIAKKYSMKLSAGIVELEYERKRKLLSLEHKRSQGASSTALSTYQSKLALI